jgi:hypothetical protein
MSDNLERRDQAQVWYDVFHCNQDGGHDFKIHVESISSPFLDHVGCPIHGVLYRAIFVKRQGHNPMAYLNTTGPGVHW